MGGRLQVSKHTTVGDRYLWVDIEATKTDVGMVILVEVKELQDVPSPIEVWANAIGKYFLYRIALDLSESEIPLYLGVTEAAYQNILSETIGQQAVEKAKISLVVFDPVREEIIRWIT
jgi:hypothetical protein